MKVAQDSRYGCLNRQLALGRCCGCIWSMCLRISICISFNPLTAFLKSLPSHLGNAPLKLDSRDTPGQLASEGVPHTMNILNSWSISDSPGNSGVREMSSAKMVPTDQISMEVW